MKTIKIFFILFFAANLTIANAQKFKLNDQVVNFGIGLGSTLYANSNYSMRIPPISFSYERGIKDGIIEKGVFSVGGYLGVSSFKYSLPGIGGYTSFASSFLIGLRGALHYPLIEDPKLDTYLGLMVFYEKASWSVKNPLNDQIGGLSWSVYIGGRYYFDKKISGVVELGYGISYLTVGVGFML
jgi:hypothetical protein